MNLDVLAIGAHPDDAELGVGGTLCKLVNAGYAAGILDLTRGELSTRGTVEVREREAAAAARVLGLQCRENAGLPDGAIANTTEQQRVLVSAIRRLRPKVLLAPMKPDRHPDHAHAHDLVTDANFFAGLGRIETGEAPYRAPALWYYYAYFEGTETPLFVIDVTDTFSKKRVALLSHASQFHNPTTPGGQETYVSSERFWQGIEERAAYWGQRIGTRYGEPFFGTAPLKQDLLPGLP
jgi:bacillithiol biosynthesis deacetylase BshB1